MEIKADGKVKKRCDRFGLVKARECPFSRSPEELRSSRKQRAADPGLLKAWEKIDSSSEEDSEDVSSSSSSSTSQSCHSSSSSSNSVLSPSVPSQTFNSSSIFHSNLGCRGKTKLSSLQRWFTLMRKKTKAVTKVTPNMSANGKKKNQKTNSVTPLNGESPDLAESSSVPGEEEQKKKKKKSIKGFFHRISAALSQVFCCSCTTHQ
ncbi:uncharacterized protein [Osmerus mordax]|uniref:uncharacterized protein n=1 Tax=Osmerus mordax TaxID=8014 RepID=UPI003510C2D2